MANNYVSNPIVLDSWGSDFVIATKGQNFVVKKIRLLSAADGDKLYFRNADGTKIFGLIQTGVGDIVEVDFGDAGFNFNQGFRCVVADNTGLGANDICWIYLA